MLRVRSKRTLAALVLSALILAAISVGDVLGLFTTTASVPGNSLEADTLNAPTGLSATSGSTITLDWTATTDTYASGHRVLRGTAAGGPYGQIAEVTPRTTTTYTDSPAGGTYYYVVRAFFQNWESANSNQASASVTTTATFGPIADSFVRSGLPNLNEGTDTVMDLNSNRDGVVRFDLSPIPAGSTITSATLSLQATSVGSATAVKNFGVHRVLMDWTEAGVTWNCGNDTVLGNGAPDCPSEGGGWSVAGTGYNGSATATIPVDGTGSYSWTVMADVAAFVSGASNFGWRVIWASNSSGTNTQANFGTKENGTASNRPVLTVTYLPP